MKRLSLVLVSMVFAALPALAVDNGACCVQTSSRLEALLNPTRGSDEDFFSYSSGAPNVLMIVDTSGSMNDWPTAWPTTRGCNSSGASGHSMLAGYVAATNYPGLYTGFTSQTIPTEHNDWFNRDRWYRFNTNQTFGTDFRNAGSPTQPLTWPKSGASSNACGLGGLALTGGDLTTCQSCLATDGYYVAPTVLGTTPVVADGNFLNFYGPRDFGAISALSHLVFSIREVRMSLMTLTHYPGGGGARCFANAGSGSNCSCLLEDFGPTCDKSYPLDKSAVQNNRNSILNKLANNGTWGGCGTPLADLMYSGAHLFKSRTGDGFNSGNGITGSYPTDSDFNEPNAPNQKTVCGGCGFNAIILITDGEPNDENLSYPSAMSTPAIGAPQCTGAYCNSKVDEIARWLWTKDLRADYANTQKVATYSVGIALNPDATKLLESVATAGGGKYYPANRSSEIEQVVLAIFQDILSRNTAFASAAVSTVQTASTSLPAVLPRMLPRSNAPWEGKLWRFEQFNEFVQEADLNGDGDQEDVFIVDDYTPAALPTVTNVVTETSDGVFVRNNTAVPATPFWEANARLNSTLASGVAARQVYTVLDSNGDGAFTASDAPVRVKLGTQAEDLRFAEYFGLRKDTTRCPSGSGPGSMLAKWGSSTAQVVTAAGIATPTTQDEWDRLCARAVILWALGADMGDVDGDGVLNEVRPSVLGDVFHSSPIAVEAPVDPFLCDLGLANQCTRTLYSRSLGVASTPMPNQTPTGSSACGSPSATTPYEAWAFEQRQRQKVVLVGANDGMVHAFSNGEFVSESCVGGQPVATFSRGTGNELWAFIPPDQLPRLADSILGHEYLVDGDVMVRDIWADGSDGSSADGAKQKSEFHTMAIVSEGRGGKHYLALELKYDSSGVAQPPGFQWMFPQPCSEEAGTFGRTFMSISPKPPPIGPVLIDSTTLPATSPLASAPSVNRYGASTHERWVVMLSGGWSPGLEKGRGVYMVDAWEGAINGRRDNLWWKFEYDPSASGFAAPARSLTQSVSAPVALVDYGFNASPGQDGFFDTAVFGDTQGQVWVGRLSTPGRYDSSTHRISNWAVARTFEMDRDGVVTGSATTLPDGGTDPADTTELSVANKSPFFYLPSVAIEPGANRMRVFTGTGNRYAVLEGGAGSCRFDNPVACSKSKCTDTKVLSRFRDGVIDLDKMETHWGNRRFRHGRLDETVVRNPWDSVSTGDLCGSNGTIRARGSNQDFTVGTCDLTSGTDPTPGRVNEVSYDCGLDSSGNSFTCTRTSVDRSGGLDDQLDSSLVDTSGLGENRFFGFWAYGGALPDGGTRAFIESAGTGVTPSTFDSARLTDRTSASATSGDLTDVTRVGCTGSGCDGGASSGGYGWVLSYNALDQKTATGAAILASCVLWSDISPSGGDGGLCSTSATPLSNIYQADFITGQPNCAVGFFDAGANVYARSQARTVVAPPPEPASVVQVSKSGQVRYSAMVVEPGQPQATTVNVSGGQDILQLVYQLPVTRALHDCRHADGGCVVRP